MVAATEAATEAAATQGAQATEVGMLLRGVAVQVRVRVRLRLRSRRVRVRVRVRGAGVVKRSHSWLWEVPCGWVVGHDTQQNVKPADDTIADARSHPMVQHIVRRAREANARALG